MKLLGIKNVKIEGGFWKDKIDLVREKTVDAVWDRFSETGRVDAYKCDPNASIPPHIFWDSDVIKWVEGAAYYIGLEYDKDLDDKINMIAERMEQNAYEDGYYNSYYAVHPEETRFTTRNNHELYCAGHLFEAAVAYYEATGSDRLLKISEKFADCIKKIFMDEKTSSFTTPGHQEIELALLSMYSVTGNKKYLDMAAFFLNKRGLGEKEDTHEYWQSHIPVRDMREAVGHSVRACYMYSAMADLAAETGDKELELACEELFKDISERKMYVTGGIGSSRNGECFTEAYDLPNEHAYAETCAAISLLFFATRMQRLNNNSKYADVAERALYNGILSGLSLDGTAFFYTNPLEINFRDRARYKAQIVDSILPITQRKRVFGCSCCPPNIVRLMPSLAKYAYGVEGDTVYVNQYMESSVDYEGKKISVKTNYPISGDVRISADKGTKLALRIPSWCKSFGFNVECTIENGYAFVEAGDDEIRLTFDMPVEFVKANPNVAACRYKVAIMRGPVVYCAEKVDNDFNIFSVCVDTESEPTLDKSFGGIPTVNVDGYITTSESALYGDKFEEKDEAFTIKMIPYYTFANRGDSDMAVWLRDE